MRSAVGILFLIVVFAATGPKVKAVRECSYSVDREYFMAIVGIGCDFSGSRGSCCPIYPKYDRLETCAAKCAAKCAAEKKRNADFGDAVMSIAIFIGFILGIINACRNDH